MSTKNKLSAFQESLIVAMRAKDIEEGDPPRIEEYVGSDISPAIIAREELNRGLLDKYSVEKRIGGKRKRVSINDL